MAENKKSVVVYADWGSVFDKLKDDEAGRLIKHFFNYVNDKNPEAPDRLTEIAFEPIKLQLKRDLIKYENIRSFRSEIGKKGGKKSGAIRSKIKQTKQVLQKGSKTKQSQANEAVTVNDTVNVNDIKEINIHPLQKYISESCANVSKLKDQLTEDDCKKLLDKYPNTLIFKKLLAMENKKDLTKKYSSVYLTLLNWCGMESEKETPVQTNKKETLIERQARLTAENHP